MLAMYGLGAWVLAPLGWPFPLLYLLFVLLSNLLFIGTVCPCCSNYGRPSCGSGYGLLAPRMSPRRGPLRFAPRFRACLPFLALAWALPPLGGAAVLYLSIGNLRALAYNIVPLAAFAVVAFGVLPFTSKRECSRCGMRGGCPGARLTAEGRHEG